MRSGSIRHTRLAAVGALAVLAAAALPNVAAAQDASPSAAVAASPDMSGLIAAAQAEGGLNVIALPRDWCNYGALLDGFTAKYGIPIDSINPDGGSGDEIQAIIANKDNPGPQAPDVIDVGVSFGPQAVDRDCSPRTRSAPGTPSTPTPRIPTETGTATTTACSPSR